MIKTTARGGGIQAANLDESSNSSKMGTRQDLEEVSLDKHQAEPTTMPKDQELLMSSSARKRTAEESRGDEDPIVEELASKRQKSTVVAKSSLE